MKKFLAKMNSRMNAKGLATSLVFALSVTACSSKQAVMAEGDASEAQAEQEMILGDSTGAEESDLLTDEVMADEEFKVDGSGDAPTAEIVQSDSPSLPANPSTWKGSLKSSFEPGMTEWKVGRGESLGLIAGAVYGNTSEWKKLLALNPEITDPNVISVGQTLRLPGSESVAKAEEVAMAPEAATPPPAAPAEKAPEEMPVVSNVVEASPPADTASASSEDAGAMGVVDTAAPADPSDSVMGGSDMNSMVQRVDVSGNKLKLRNILLGVAAFFLLLAGLIFVLSRRKAAKVG